MGQYLALGLTYKIHAFSLSAMKFDKEKEKIQKSLRDFLDYDLDLFNLREKGGDFVFTIKDEIFKNEMYPLLEDIYALINGKPSCPAALKQLRSLPLHEWLEFAEQNENEDLSFTNDFYAELTYFTFKQHRIEVMIRNHCFILHTGYGKIQTEGIDDFLSIFNSALHNAFQNHSFGNMVNVFIRG